MSSFLHKVGSNVHRTICLACLVIKNSFYSFEKTLHYKHESL